MADYIDQNLLDQVEKVAKEHLVASPFDHQILFQLGNVYYLKGEFQLAFDCFLKAVNLSPVHASYSINLGHSLRKLGETDQAIDSYQSVLVTNPRFADAHFYVGLLHFENRKFDHAFSSFNQALLVNPKYIAPRYYLGRLLEDNGEFRQAMNEYRRVIEYGLGKKILEERVTVNCGSVFSDAGLLEDAEKYYRKLLREHPDYADLHYQLGIVLKKMGKTDEAMEEFHFAIKLNPQYMEARRKYWETAR
ncbi:MAG: tetratricopeptide repeat protein [Candidatus Riflebacteria bacterium]|nr:tetratricopeptide repeat protein [Candidatus Riflebacteria bacterium]